MTNFILFSDYFKPIANKIKFVATVIGRFFKIMLRRRKRIELLQLDYSKKYLFDKSFLIIKYRFKNVLWYNFKDLKKTTEKKSIVFNLANINSSTIVFIVNGFFQKKVYQLTVQPDNLLLTKSFQTSFFNFNNQNNYSPSLKLLAKKPVANISNIDIKRSPLLINHSPYNQTDFI
jgi:hypothetical protein